MNNISNRFYSFPEFPLENALFYSKMKVNKYMNRTKLNKTSKNPYHVYIFTLLMYGSVSNSRPIENCYISHKWCKKQNVSNKMPAFLSKSVSSLIEYLMKICIKARSLVVSDMCSESNGFGFKSGC